MQFILFFSWPWLSGNFKFSFHGNIPTAPCGMPSGRGQEMLTVANGKFQSVNELLQGTSGQYREEKPENGFLII